MSSITRLGWTSILPTPVASKLPPALVIIVCTCRSPGESSLSLLLTLWRCRPLLSALRPRGPACPLLPPSWVLRRLSLQQKEPHVLTQEDSAEGCPRDDLSNPSSHSVNKYLSKVFPALNAVSDAGHSALNRQKLLPLWVRIPVLLP